MKLILLISLLHYSNAAKEQMKALLAELAENADVEDGNQRGFANTWAAQMIDSIDGYGCWCYFDDAHGSGRGTPQNRVDEFCKGLHDGYSCVIVDDKNDECGNPWEIVYESATGFGGQPGGNTDDDFRAALKRRCINANRGSNKCKWRTCVVEGNFIISFFEAFLDSVGFDPSLKHSLNNFDPKLECSSLPNPGPSHSRTRECCGSYPTRFPYFTAGDKKCCGGVTYNSNVNECCDKQVTSLGTC